MEERTHDTALFSKTENRKTTNETEEIKNRRIPIYPQTTCAMSTSPKVLAQIGTVSVRKREIKTGINDAIIFARTVSMSEKGKLSSPLIDATETIEGKNRIDANGTNEKK